MQQRHVGFFFDELQHAFRQKFRLGLKQHARRFARFALRIHLRRDHGYATTGPTAFHHRRVEKNLAGETRLAVAQTELFPHRLSDERIRRGRFRHATFVNAGENQMGCRIER